MASQLAMNTNHNYCTAQHLCPANHHILQGSQLQRSTKPLQDSLPLLSYQQGDY